MKDDEPVIPPSERRTFWEKLREAPAVALFLPLFWVALRKGWGH